jgi:hypothetical protein
MFCPVCKAEYRPGYTRCSDCNLALVPALPPQADPPPPESDDAGPDSVVLCQEDHPAVLTAILAALQERGIPFFDYPVRDPMAHLDRPFPVKLGVGQLYEIRVPKSDLPAAQGVLTDVLEEEPEASETQAPETEPTEGASPDEVEADEVLSPDAAVAEAWCGPAGDLEGFLTTALRENGIATRREGTQDGSGRIRICVTPEKLARAREIVREIVEASPPE